MWFWVSYFLGFCVFNYIMLLRLFIKYWWGGEIWGFREVYGEMRLYIGGEVEWSGVRRKGLFKLFLVFYSWEREYYVLV